MTSDNHIQHDPHMKIGAKIRERRQQLALSIDDLTAISGVDPATISRTETGSSQMTFYTAIELSRALRVPLPDLIDAIRTPGQRIAGVEPNTSLLHITERDVADFVSLYSTHRQQAEDLVVRWLSNLALLISEDESDCTSPDLQVSLVQFLLARSKLFQFELRFPGDSALVAVPITHQLGGDIDHGDIQLFLAGISNDKALFQKLDRQSKDVMRRLQSQTPDRVKVADLAKLETELHIDLFGMIATAEGVGAKDFDDSNGESDKAACEARLIALFIRIACWFKTLQPDSDEWIATLRAYVQPPAPV